VAAISISGPSSRLDSSQIPALIPQMKRISSAITSELAVPQDSAEGA